MNLTEALSGFSYSALNVTSTRPKRLEKAVDRVERKADGLEVPGDLEEFDYDKALDDLTRGVASRRQLKRLAAGGLTTFDGLSNRGQLLDALLAAVDSLGRSLLKALLIGYLLQPDTSTRTAREVRRFLLARSDRLPKQWERRVSEYRLLDESVGGHCSKLILDSRSFNAQSFIAETGLGGVKSAGGVASEIFSALSEALSKGHQSDSLDRFFEYVTTDTGVRFSSHVNDYAKALLTPYQGGTPTDDVRTRIESFLVENFGDPRMKPAAWSGVPDGLMDVMRRWLAKASLELLLSVVNESNDTEHWEDRSKFWGYYFDQGLVLDAWVALGRNAALVARRLVKQGVLQGASDYGVIDGGSVQADHSVLMFRIGDFVISEWTHSGKVRMYDVNNKHCPSFYERKYNANNIRNDRVANFFVVHNSRWRDRVAGFLHHELGIHPPKGVVLDSSMRRCKSCGSNLHILWYASEYATKCSRCALKALYV